MIDGTQKIIFEGHHHIIEEIFQRTNHKQGLDMEHTHKVSQKIEENFQSHQNRKDKEQEKKSVMH